MISQVTNGIKVSVKTNYEGTFYQDLVLKYAFSYKITIANNSKHTVQLQRRRWNIFDSLNETEVVKGEGVIGETPIIFPGDSHTYTSGCALNAPYGSMNGHYTMTDLNTGERLKVFIPTFNLIAPFGSN